MEVILLMGLLFVGYIVAYLTYGRYLANRIFKLRKVCNVPSREFEDGVDYVPTKRGVIFGHHFTSIAGTGPIVGPAIAIVWGWVPAIIWVFVGSIFMGAVHDLGSMVISLRNQGKSIADIAARYVNPRVQTIMFCVVFLELLIVIAVFGLVIALLFRDYPQAVFPIWCEIPIALVLGWAVYKRNGSVLWLTVAAVVAMYATVIAGHWVYWDLPATILGIPLTGVWTIVLLIYAYVASTLPVTTLLQPRDYINAWQLFVAMALLIGGAVAAGLWGGMDLVSPTFDPTPAKAPPFWPFLFVTIACGAISGFHCLVASGTSSKQLGSERDALPVGYGSMLVEGALAVLVIVVVAAGVGLAHEVEGQTLSGEAAWRHYYPGWLDDASLSKKLAAYVEGSANMVRLLGIPREIALVVMGVFVASFAGTTLDTATRIQRYVIGELATRARVPAVANRYVATLIAVVTAGAMAFSTGWGGSGAMTLWPMFGSLNQVLAALALLIVTVYLRKKGGRKFLLTAIPCLFMLVMTIWATVLNEWTFLFDAEVKKRSVLLAGINGLTLILVLWMVIEVFVCFRGLKVEPQDEDEGVPAATVPPATGER